MKLCKNCKHAVKDKAFPERLEFLQCNAHQNMIISPVDGERIRKLDYCSTTRLDCSSELCGTEARWYEPKAKEEPQKIEFYKRKVPLFERLFRTEYWEAK